MVALIGIAEHEFLAWQSLAALRTGHIFPPKFAASASDAISHVYLINVVFEGFATWTDSKSKFLLAAFAAELVMPFEDCLVRVEDVLPPADAADQFECEGASDAGDIRAHAIVVLLLVE